MILCFNCSKTLYSKIYYKTFENACPIKACKIEKQHFHDFCIFCYDKLSIDKDNLEKHIIDKNCELHMESDFGFEFYNAIKSLERFFDNLKTTISFSKLDLEVRPDLKNEYLKLENEFLINHKNFLKLNDYVNKFDKRSLPFTYPCLKKKRNKRLDNNNEFIN
jgi:hypothetical protein